MLLCYSCKPELSDIETTFIRKFGTGVTNEGNDIVETSDKGFLILGTIDNNIAKKGTNIYLYKTDKTGMFEWEKSFDLDYDQTGNSIAQTPDGEYMIVGNTKDSLGFLKILVLKINQKGDTIFTKKYGTQLNTWGNKIISLTNGNYAIAGNTQEAVGAEKSGVYYIINNLGKIIQTNTLSSSEYNSCIQHDQTDVFFAGTSKNEFLLQSNTNKSAVFPHNSRLQNCYDVKLFKDSTYFLTGTIASGTDNSADSGMNIYIVKLKMNPFNDKYLINNAKIIGSKKDDIAKSMCIDAKDNIYITGTRNIDTGNSDVFLYGLDNSLQMKFEKTFASSGLQSANKIISTSDGGLVILGTNKYTNNSSILLLKTSSDGTLQ